MPKFRSIRGIKNHLPRLNLVLRLRVCHPFHHCSKSYGDTWLAYRLEPKIQKCMEISIKLWPEFEPKIRSNFDLGFWYLKSKNVWISRSTFRPSLNLKYDQISDWDFQYLKSKKCMEFSIKFWPEFEPKIRSIFWPGFLVPEIQKCMDFSINFWPKFEPKIRSTFWPGFGTWNPKNVWSSRSTFRPNLNLKYDQFFWPVSPSYLPNALSSDETDGQTVTAARNWGGTGGFRYPLSRGISVLIQEIWLSQL